MGAWRLVTFVFAAVLIGAGTPTAGAQAADGGEATQADSREAAPARERPVLDVDAVRVQVTPELGFVLPYGIIVQQTELDVGRSRVGTKAEFDLPQNGVSGQISVARRFGTWEPRARVYQEIISEPFATAELSDGELFAVPEEEFVRRTRGAAGNLRYYVNEDVHLSAGSTFVEVLETRFVDDESVDANVREFLITPSIAAVFSALSVQSPLGSSIIRGGYARFEIAHQVDGDTLEPNVTTARIGSIWFHEPIQRIDIEIQASATTPVRVWNEDEFAPPIVGGFDTVRGFTPGHLAETRGALLRNTFKWNPSRALDAEFESPVVGTDRTVPIAFRDARLLAAIDAAIVQDEIRWDSPVTSVVGTGPGVAVTVSIGRYVHFDLRAFLVWPIGVSDEPVFYLQGSLFSP